MNLYLDCSFKAPSHATVLLWVKKYGLHLLCDTVQKSEDWVVIIDESVQFGQNKLLLVYGVRQADIDFSRSLTFSDLTPLVLASKSSWTGDLIAEQLEKLEPLIGKIIYAVADQGNSIKKALKIRNVHHVYDITHCISLILEHIYKNDSEFKEYTKQLTYLRVTQSLSKTSHLLPPAQRTNSRFMNLRPISDWGISVLNLLENAPKSFSVEKEALQWAMKHKSLITELALLNEMINDIQLILKTRGLSLEALEACSTILNKANKDRLYLFKDALMEHLDETIKASPMDKTINILCSSDIIESAFGKFKNYISNNPMTGITNLSLSLAAFTGKLSGEEVMKALSTIKEEKVKNWSRKNIGETTLSKRIRTLKWNEYLN